MFSWFSRKSARVSAPSKSPTNPGIGTEGRVAFSDGERSWHESFNAVQSLRQAMKRAGHDTVAHDKWLEHRPSGFLFVPQMVELEPLEGTNVRTVTTIEAVHPTLAPRGLFEFQHSTGSNIDDSIGKGFDQWSELDLVTILDSCQPSPNTCMLMEMEFPAQQGVRAMRRRAVLGPCSYVQEFTPVPPEDPDPADHPFCTCCFFTRALQAFTESFRTPGYYGIRFFAARDQNGEAQADCRVNGNDWDKGKEVLRDYVATWAPAGYEFRKQYVVVSDQILA